MNLDLTGRFRSELRDERVAARLGIATAVLFGICFVTGIVSHLVQDSPGWFQLPARPAGIYQWTQGLHVVSGLASIPLLLMKLWTVFPKLFAWPPFRSVAQALERLALLPLVGGALLLVFTGVGNIHFYRPWEFSFRRGHYAAAWIMTGALVVHVGVQWGTARLALRRDAKPSPGEVTIDRRAFVRSGVGIAGLVAVFTAGQTFSPLRRLGLLAPRQPDIGPQGFPINRSAASVGLVHVDRGAYRLVVDGPGVAEPRTYGYADLAAFPQHDARVAITCVEGWSTTQTWRGVRVRDLLADAGARPGADVVVHALHTGRQSTAPLPAAHAADADTLLALQVNGEMLHPDHGFPVRLVGQNRPGVHQTKWVGRLEVG